MKKIAIILIAVVAVVAIVAGFEAAEVAVRCVKEETAVTNETVGKNDTHKNFLEVPEEDDALEAYRKEVVKRLDAYYFDSQRDFLTPEEKEYLEARGYFINGYTITTYTSPTIGEEIYTYPVIYQSDLGIELWFTGQSGNIYIDRLEGNVKNYRNYTWKGHHFPTESETIIDSTEKISVSFESSTGRVTFWELGEIIKEAKLPANSVYAGKSDLEGYIFRSNTDVYAVDYGEASHPDSVIIAHNVEQVILADYSASTYERSLPLLQMKDGTLKIYCSWYGDVDAPTDDESHLVDIFCEGGYK